MLKKNVLIQEHRTISVQDIVVIPTIIYEKDDFFFPYFSAAISVHEIFAYCLIHIRLNRANIYLSKLHHLKLNGSSLN